MPKNSGTSATSISDTTPQTIELAVRLETLANIVERLVEANDGTIKTMGLKERITIAEYNTEANKKAFKDMQESMHQLEERIGKNILQANNYVREELKRELGSFNEAINSILEQKLKSATKEINEAFVVKTKEINDSFETKLKEVQTVTSDQNNFLNKIKPYVSIIQWAITLAATYILTQILSGNIVFSFVK